MNEKRQGHSGPRGRRRRGGAHAKRRGTGATPIGPDDLRAKFVELYTQTGTSENERLSAFYAYLLANQDQLSPEALVLVDKLSEVIKSEFGKALQDAPNTPELHPVRRMFARLTGEHVDASGLIGALESKPVREHPFAQAARPLFEKHLQTYLDRLWDVVQHTQSGAAAAAQISMFALCADEMLVAFHLAQRGYANQAFTHQRIVLEALGLIELFTRTPEAADEWMVPDPRATWEKFKPSKVRRALGQRPWDPFYSFLSSYGTHVTWRTLQIRMGIFRPREQHGTPQIRLFVGGTPIVGNLIHANLLCLYLLFSSIIKFVGVFSEFILPNESLVAMREAGLEILQFVLDHYLPWARQEGLDVDEMERFLRDQVTLIDTTLPLPDGPHGQHGGSAVVEDKKPL